MKLLNLSGSKQEFSDVCKKTGKMTMHSCEPGAEMDVPDDHPLAEQLKALPVKYPKDWKEVAEKKLSKAELQAELAKAEAAEKAEKKAAEEKAAAEKKAADDAAKKAKQ